jgi:hypothetical protein
MSNVIQFPIDRKVETIAGEISNLQVEITERFEKLTQLFVTSRELEQECGQLQTRYDSLVMEYAAAIGPENIPAGILEYCTQVIAKCEGDDEFTLELAAPLDEDTKRYSSENLDQIHKFMESVTKFIKGQLDELQ